jgi:urease accessory protein
MITDFQAFLRLLQLVSPALPVGAYSYSEGLETLVQASTIADRTALEFWLTQELRQGAIRLESAVVARVHTAAMQQDYATLHHWNQWLSAFRETEEMRQQSWQMGRSLVRLLQALQPDPLLQPSVQALVEACGEPCNFAVAFAIAAAAWQIDRASTSLGYLHSWAGNLVNASVRLIPLGQTQGQQILLSLYPQLEQTAIEVLELPEDEFGSCSWGAAIASMTHETLYSRLFRS